MNSAFRLPTNDPKTLDYGKVFSSADNFFFEESHGIYRIFIEHCLRQYDGQCFYDISPHYAKFRRVYDKHPPDQLFVWNNGKGLCFELQGQNIIEREFAYLHFQKRHMRITLSLESPERFAITPNGFIILPRDLSINPGVVKALSNPTVNNNLAFYYNRAARTWKAARMKCQRIFMR